jgi:hypothetical protein
MVRFAGVRFAVVAAALASLSDASGAEDARPVVFWASILDPTHPSVPLSFRSVPGTFPPASVTGWMCTASAPRIFRSPGMAADPAHGIPAVPPTMGQTADLTCTTGAGSIAVTALCMLGAADGADEGRFTLKDPQGHVVELSIHCANNLPPASVAELRALKPGDSLSTHLALHASTEPGGDGACNPPFAFDPDGLKHFKPECL